MGNIHVNFSPGALVDVQAGTLVGTSSYQGIWTANQASLNIASGATFDAVEGGPTGAMQFDALTGAGTLSGGYISNPGGVSTLTFGVAGGGGTFSGSLQDDISAHLAIIKAGSGIQSFTGTNTYTGGTTVSGGSLVIGAATALPTGSAVVNNSALLINANTTAGVVSGAGTTTITSGVTLTAASFAQGGLSLQLGGAAADADAKLSVTGALSLAGTLTVGLVNNFTPSLGNTFKVLDWGSRLGTFSKLQLPALNAGPLGWDTSQLYAFGLLSVTDTVPGDFDRDGQLTAADIPAMLTALTDLNSYASNNSLSPAQMAAIGDFDSSSTVTNRDIQGLLDLVASGSGSASAVPEPSNLLLAVLGLLTFALFKVTLWFTWDPERI